MNRKLFCEISPLTYSISVIKCRNIRHIKNIFDIKNIARKKSEQKLPYLIYDSNSLIRRKLGNVDMQLQENKATNLKIATPKVSGILIRPQETFSFWSLVGPCSKIRGYKEGLTIGKGSTGKGVGGGMCQFTNLIHWLVLHTPLTITEHHHHNGVDMFPDFNRQVPFGVGTSILYNYLDYRFTNNTDTTFQLITYVTDEYLCGEILADKPLDIKYHIDVEDEYFSNENDIYYRHNKIFRKLVDKNTGNTISKELIMENKAKVMYDSKFIDKEKIRN